MRGKTSGPSVTAQFLSRLVEFLDNFIAPRQLVPIRVRATRRQIGRRLVVVSILIFLGAGSVWADGTSALPRSVPDIFNPEVRAHYQPVQVGNLQANPDLPLLMLVNINGESPKAVLVGLDARNGKNTWSLNTDPIVLIALFTDPSTITELYLDAGFTRQGAPSGRYQSIPDPRVEMLPELLRAFSDVPARTYM
jgi:hypothetical protein